MTNAATALAALLADWNVTPNTNPESVRGMTEPGLARRDFWRQQAQAISLAQSVDNVLRGMEASGQPTFMYDASMVSWYEAVFSYSVPWQQSNNSNRPIIEPPRLENLQALGVMLDQVGEVAFSDDEVKGLRTTLEEARDLIALDTNLSRETRRYMWSLVVEALATLDEIETFGTEPVRSILLELGGAAGLQADVADGHSDAPTAGRWRAIRDRVIAGFASDVGHQVAIEATKIAEKAIEQGLH